VIYLCILAAAVFMLLWPDNTTKAPTPAKVSPLPSTPVPAIPLPRKSPSYMAAIESLAEVRNRLIATGTLDDKAIAAINDLTLCLVAGSDKE
jgi:hypothetical protein